MYIVPIKDIFLFLSNIFEISNVFAFCRSIFMDSGAVYKG